MDAVTLVGGPRDDLVQEDHVVGILADGHIPVRRGRQRLRQLGQFVVMRGKQRAAADHVVQMLGHGPGERDAVVRARAAADLVENHQAPRGGRVEDAGRLRHLDHERALPFAQLVAGADAGENAVGDADPRVAGRHERPHLRQDRDQRRLPNVRAFARHVRAR